MINLYARVVGLIYFDPDVDDLCVFGNISMICLWVVDLNGHME